jgi:translation initiation factor eIF-2B subunit epsilon
MLFGKDSNAIVWPRGPPDEEDDELGPENWRNQQFMKIGNSIRPFSTLDNRRLSFDQVVWT